MWLGSLLGGRGGAVAVGERSCMDSAEGGEKELQRGAQDGAGLLPPQGIPQQLQ